VLERWSYSILSLVTAAVCNKKKTGSSDENTAKQQKGGWKYNRLSTGTVHVYEHVSSLNSTSQSPTTNNAAGAAIAWEMWEEAVGRSIIILFKNYTGSKNHSPNQLRKRSRLIPGTVTLLHPKERKRSIMGIRRGVGLTWQSRFTRKGLQSKCATASLLIKSRQTWQSSCAETGSYWGLIIVLTYSRLVDEFGYSNYKGIWPSAKLFGWSAADWSRRATNNSISSERKRKSLVFCWKEKKKRKDSAGSDNSQHD